MDIFRNEKKAHTGRLQSFVFLCASPKRKKGVERLNPKKTTTKVFYLRKTKQKESKKKSFDGGPVAGPVAPAAPAVAKEVAVAPPAEVIAPVVAEVIAPVAAEVVAPVVSNEEE